AGAALARHVGGALGRNQLGQFLLDIGAHAEVLRPRLLRRIDVEARAFAEIVAFIVGNIVTARAGVGRDEDHAAFGAGAAVLALFHDVRVGAGQARQIPQHRQPGARRVFRHVDREGHVRAGGARPVLVDALDAAEALVLADRLDAHDWAALPFADVRREDADLVAVGIAQIGAVHVARRFLAEARGAFVGSARFEARLVPGIDLVIVFGGEAKRVAVGHAHRFAIGRLGDDEGPGRAGINGAVRKRVPLVAEHAHRRVVE